MTKNIILTIVISMLAVTVGFTSCNNSNKGTLQSADIPNVDSGISFMPDTAIKTIIYADSSWHNANEAFKKAAAPVSEDTISKSSKKTLGTPKLKILGNPLRPQELLDGLTKAQNGDLRGAIVDFDSCIVKNNRNYNAYFYKAKAFIELNEPQNALSNLNLAILYGFDNPIFYYYRGKVYFDSGDTAKAYDDFDHSVVLKPDFPDGLNYRGVIKELRGNHSGAIEDYNAALKANPAFSTAWYNKGTSEAAMQLYEDASSSFSKCVELDPKKIMGFMNRGNCYVMLKDFKSAVKDYTSVISFDPGNSDAYYNRGVAYHLAGDQSSCNDWQKALSLGNKKANTMLKEYCK